MWGMVSSEPRVVSQCICGTHTPQDQAKSVKTKRYAKDTDQIHEELKRVQAGLPRTSKAATTIQEADPEDLPGQPAS